MGFRVVGVEHKQGVEELQGHTTQVPYSGYWYQESDRELKSHTTYILLAGINVFEVRTLRTSLGKSKTRVVAVAR